MEQTCCLAPRRGPFGGVLNDSESDWRIGDLRQDAARRRGQTRGAREAPQSVQLPPCGRGTMDAPPGAYPLRGGTGPPQQSREECTEHSPGWRCQRFREGA
jgi:hypothetical protein